MAILAKTNLFSTNTNLRKYQMGVFHGSRTPVIALHKLAHTLCTIFPLIPSQYIVHITIQDFHPKILTIGQILLVKEILMEVLLEDLLGLQAQIQSMLNCSTFFANFFLPLILLPIPLPITLNMIHILYLLRINFPILFTNNVRRIFRDAVHG